MTAAPGLLEAAYAPLLALSDRLVAADDETLGWTPTALPGWTVRDLVFHLAGDAQRALVALHTPTDAAADTDAASYWSAWRPGGDATERGLRATRTSASQWTGARGPARLHAETARAVLHAAAAADPAAVVSTQGHTLTVAALISTLAVEAAVHHLDLAAVLPERPAAGVLAEVRRVTEVLLGAAVPAGWDDVRWALLATGRATTTATERAALGSAAERLPLFG